MPDTPQGRGDPPRARVARGPGCIPLSGMSSLQGKAKGVMECWHTKAVRLPAECERRQRLAGPCRWCRSAGRPAGGRAKEEPVLPAADRLHRQGTVCKTSAKLGKAGDGAMTAPSTRVSLPLCVSDADGGATQALPGASRSVGRRTHRPARPPACAGAQHCFSGGFRVRIA